MGGPGAGAGEKAKDFNSAIKRLFSELRGFKAVILVALILAIAGSILSISAPNILSDLTDEISTGLVVNKDNMQELSSKITENFSQEKMADVMPKILQMNLSKDSITQIMSSQDISTEDKQKFQDVIKQSSESEKQDELFKSIAQLPESILNIILPDSTYEGKEISSKDKIELLTLISQMQDGEKNTNITIPESMKDILFSEFEIDGTKISTDDQYKYITEMSTLTEGTSASELYAKIDKMPESIQKVVKPFMNIDKIKKITLILVCIYLASALCTYIQSISMTIVANKFAKSLRSRISTKINKLPLKYFDRHQTGDILSRVTNDVDTIAQSMNQSLATLVSSVTLFLGTIIMMFVTNWILAITAIVASLIGFIGMILILKKSQKYFVARQENLGNLNGHIEEVYSGLNVVKAYNGRKKADEEFDKLNQKVCDSNRKSQFFSGLMMPIMNFIGNFGYVAVCIVGALLAADGSISFGVIVAFITYVRLFTSPLSQIAQAMTSLQSTAAASERVFEFVDEEEMTNQSNITKTLDRKDVKGKIEFKNVWFAYEDENWILKDVSLTINPGESIALVGKTGSGKTTITNLINRFYKIQKGEILLDGVNINDINLKSLRKNIGTILQDPFIFAKSLKDNIKLYSDVSDERINEAVKLASATDFINSQNNGINEISAERGNSYSAGQKQLIAFARIFAQNPSIFILDEATANIDTTTEELIQKSVDKISAEKTSIFIAHRLSTIVNVDKIIVLNKGKILEQGNHSELLQKDGYYAKLYNAYYNSLN